MANWKKIITSGSKAHLNQITASGNINVAGVATFNDITATGLADQSSEATAVMINGSNVVGTRELGSNAFTSTTIGTTTAALTAGAGLNNGGGTFNGSTARTFSINSGSMAAFYSSSAFSKVSGDVEIAGTGVATIQANAVEGSMLNSNVVDNTGAVLREK